MTEQLDLISWIADDPTPVECPAPSLDAVRLIRIDPARNMRRFYDMHFECDLFGTALLARQWGRIGSPRGRLRYDAFTTEAEAMQALAKLRKSKERRGYRSGE